jgi:hypothetical protein
MKDEVTWFVDSVSKTDQNAMPGLGATVKFAHCLTP